MSNGIGREGIGRSKRQQDVDRPKALRYPHERSRDCRGSAARPSESGNSKTKQQARHTNEAKTGGQATPPPLQSQGTAEASRQGCGSGIGSKCVATEMRAIGSPHRGRRRAGAQLRCWRKAGLRRAKGSPQPDENQLASSATAGASRQSSAVRCSSRWPKSERP